MVTSSDNLRRRNLTERTCRQCRQVFLARPDRKGWFCSKGCLQGNRNQRGMRGWYVDAAGYRRAKAPVGHPRAHKTGWMLEHRLIMERHLGRILVASEYVHHRNGVRSDNRLENLELWRRKDPPGVRASDYHCPGCTCLSSRRA